MGDLYETPTITSEVDIPQETAPVPEVVKPIITQQLIAQQGDDNNIAVEKGITPVSSIVDQTDTITTLHHIENPREDLTEFADKEEEEFIEKVEKRHGSR